MPSLHSTLARCGRAVIAAAGLLLLAGCNKINFWRMDGHQSTIVVDGPVAREQLDLFIVTCWVALVIFIVVGAVLAYATFKFRARSEDDEQAAPPEQSHGNPLVELSLIVASVLALVIIAIPTLKGIWNTYDVPEAEKKDAYSVNATGFQWWFRFEYPDEIVPMDATGSSKGPMVVANELVIPAGRFLMGSPPEEKGRFDYEEKQHSVTISHPFLLAETEVTQAQFKAVMGENPVAVRTWKSSIGNSVYKCSDKGVDQAGDKRLPVWCVDFFDAVRYVNQLSTQEKLTPCYEINGTQVQFKGLSCPGYRLPTEAEWEYAARANQPTLYAGSDDPKAVAWFDENSEGRPHPVATRQANAFLLHDMSGNLWEWVWDVYRDDYEKDVPVDPQGGNNEKDSARVRVVRGGSWFGVARNQRVAYRAGLAPSFRDGYLGFRPARSLP